MYREFIRSLNHLNLELYEYLMNMVSEYRVPYLIDSETLKEDCQDWARQVRFSEPLAQIVAFYEFRPKSWILTRGLLPPKFTFLAFQKLIL